VPSQCFGSPLYGETRSEAEKIEASCSDASFRRPTATLVQLCLCSSHRKKEGKTGFADAVQCHEYSCVSIREWWLPRSQAIQQMI